MWNRGHQGNYRGNKRGGYRNGRGNGGYDRNYNGNYYNYSNHHQIPPQHQYSQNYNHQTPNTNYNINNNNYQQNYQPNYQQGYQQRYQQGYQNQQRYPNNYSNAGYETSLPVEPLVNEPVDEKKRQYDEPMIEEEKKYVEETVKPVKSNKKSLMKFKRRKVEKKVTKVEETNLFETEDQQTEEVKKHSLHEEVKEKVQEDTLENSNTLEKSISVEQAENGVEAQDDKNLNEDLDEDLDKYLSTLAESDKSIHGNILNTENISDDDIDEIYNADLQLLNSLNTDKNKKIIPKHELSTQPIEKSFYIESNLIKSLTKNEVKQLRNQDGIIIRGKHIQKPILEWNQLGLPNEIFQILQANKFSSPTPIQCESLPNIMSGNDLIGIAKTGSGKTIAFLLPLFRHLLSNINNITDSKTFLGSSPRAIILTPTRELSIQIGKSAQPFADKLGLKIVKCYGGISISKQINELKRGCDILIGTPGRIIDLLCTNSGRILRLSYVSFLVMDEADRMLDLGFEPQIIDILSNLRNDRQSLLFSATFPIKIQTIARKILKDPIEIIIGNKNKVNENITNSFHVVDKNDEKMAILLKTLGTCNTEREKILIFMEKQKSCDEMVNKLISRGYAVMSLHGGKDQYEREGIIKDLRDGIINILVATSIASRGLDINGLNMVINYDAPSHREDYVHRVGRTGRGINHGEAITFLIKDLEDRKAYEICQVVDKPDSKIVEMSEKWINRPREESNDGDGDGNINNNNNKGFIYGFSGHGLERLESIRNEAQNEEKNKYLDDDQKPGDLNNSKLDDELIDSSVLGPVDVTIGQNGEYVARLEINNLPQKVRWNVTAHETTSRVEELASVSVVLKGVYKDPNSNSNSKDEPLYMTVEGPSEIAVRRGVSLLQENIRSNLQRLNV